MTRLVCSSHFYIGLWILSCSVGVLGMVLNINSIMTPAPEVKTGVAWDIFFHEEKVSNDYFFSQLQFGMSLALVFITNVFGLLFSNMKYGWVGLKSC